MTDRELPAERPQATHRHQSAIMARLNLQELSGHQPEAEDARQLERAIRKDGGVDPDSRDWIGKLTGLLRAEGNPEDDSIIKTLCTAEALISGKYLEWNSYDRQTISVASDIGMTLDHWTAFSRALLERQQQSNAPQMARQAVAQRLTDTLNGLPGDHSAVAWCIQSALGLSDLDWCEALDHNIRRWNLPRAWRRAGLPRGRGASERIWDNGTPGSGHSREQYQKTIGTLLNTALEHPEDLIAVARRLQRERNRPEPGPWAGQRWPVPPALQALIERSWNIHWHELTGHPNRAIRERRVTCTKDVTAVLAWLSESTTLTSLRERWDHLSWERGLSRRQLLRAAKKLLELSTSLGEGDWRWSGSNAAALISSNDAELDRRRRFPSLHGPEATATAGSWTWAWEQASSDCTWDDTAESLMIELVYGQARDAESNLIQGERLRGKINELQLSQDELGEHEVSDYDQAERTLMRWIKRASAHYSSHDLRRLLYRSWPIISAELIGRGLTLSSPELNDWTPRPWIYGQGSVQSRSGQRSIKTGR